MTEKHTISVLVENHFGVLSRVSGLISARGFNIDSLTVSTTEDPTISRMTIVVEADGPKLEQVKHQLGRLIDVIEVQELKEGQFIDRELLLARVKTNGAVRATLEDLALMVKHSPAPMQVKAAGGVRDLDALLKVRALGVTRCGASRTVEMLEEGRKRLGLPPITTPGGSGKASAAGY